MLRVGIVGPGAIAAVMVKAMRESGVVEPVAVSSRKLQNAEQFKKEHGLKLAFGDWKEMCHSDQVDAIYVATPTNFKEDICVTAANAKKHVLCEKPFPTAEVAKKITEACRSNKVAFMDGTHFVHAPRTAKIHEMIAKEIGEPIKLRSAFHVHDIPKDSQRLDPKCEPYNVLGDLGWYNMRVIVEYLPKRGKIEKIVGYTYRDPDTGGIRGGSGAILFDNGHSSTFELGYDCGASLQDVDVIGTEAVIRLDDFVLDWSTGFLFEKDDSLPAVILKRKGWNRPEKCQVEKCPSALSAAACLMRDFADLSKNPSGPVYEDSIQKTLETQKLLDAVFNAIGKQ